MARLRLGPTSMPASATRRRGRSLVWALAALIGVVTALYRFAPLGGAFGGFDNDHFVHFAHAKQVQAGEQPLRDFLDAGLQGARPSLTYELSAWAQTLFGNSLLPEAALTVGGVALGASVTFLAAATLGAWPAALVTTVLSVLVSPKLYGYPKVLVLSVASLLVARYLVGAGGRGAVVGFAGWTAVAFLFRHDYALYCAAAFAVTMATTARDPVWRRVVSVASYGSLTLGFLGPSLWWVHAYAGIPAYLENGLAMGRAEALRTEIGWPRFELVGSAPLWQRVASEGNTQAWMYYLFLAVALAGIVVGLRDTWGGPRRAPRAVSGRGAPQAGGPALVAIGLMCACLWMTFLRGNLESRFGDMAAPVAVVASVLLTRAFRPLPRVTAARRGARAALAVSMLAVTAAAIWIMAEVSAEVRSGRLLTSPATLVERVRRVAGALGEEPALMRRTGDGPLSASAYLHRCTASSDRILLVGYAPEVPVFAERLFAGGRASFLQLFYLDARYSRYAIERLERESVPIVLSDEAGHSGDIPLVPAFVRARYRAAGAVPSSGGPLRVWVRDGLASRPDGPTGLPCLGAQRAAETGQQTH